MSKLKVLQILPLAEVRIVLNGQTRKEVRVHEGWAARIEEKNQQIYTATIYYSIHGLYQGFIDTSTGSFEFVWSPHGCTDWKDGEPIRTAWDKNHEFMFLMEQYLNQE